MFIADWRTTNNFAEARAFELAVLAAQMMGIRRLDIYGDSKYWKNVLCPDGTKAWVPKEPHIVEQHRHLQALSSLQEIEWTLTHIPSTQNDLADYEYNKAADTGEDYNYPPVLSASHLSNLAALFPSHPCKYCGCSNPHLKARAVPRHENPCFSHRISGVWISITYESTFLGLPRAKKLHWTAWA